MIHQILKAIDELRAEANRIAHDKNLCIETISQEQFYKLLHNVELSTKLLRKVKFVRECPYFHKSVIDGQACCEAGRYIGEFENMDTNFNSCIRLKPSNHWSSIKVDIGSSDD